MPKGIRPSTFLCDLLLTALRHKPAMMGTSLLIEYVMLCIILLEGGRLMPMSSKDMIRLLEKNGFRIVPGGKGSHQKLRHPDGAPWCPFAART
ncbi:MAG: type II toxin-antitoxin system HicA family toxin [Clostridiales bacterium]|nr:type II toxin-antitoxin system HicA family toxin [Clostridiales bacterium]